MCLCSIVIAQETKVTKFEMNEGDTVVWKSFETSGRIKYDVLDSKFIDYQIFGLGNEIQVIAKSKGTSVITAISGEAQSQAMFMIKGPEVESPVVVIPEKPATQPFTSTYSFNPPADNFFITVTNPVSECRETFVKIGNKEAYNDGREIDSFDNEVDKSNLSKYYVGMERVLDVNCWHFFVDNEDGVTQYWVDPANGCTLKRQVNSETPREVTVYDLMYTKLTFGPYFKKGLHDTRR